MVNMQGKQIIVRWWQLQQKQEQQQTPCQLRNQEANSQML
jgi:hypothetical protein